MSELEIYKGIVKKMKDDEIKEILDYISDRIIPNEKWNKVRDYITNLQQENEKKNAYIKYLEEYNPKYYKGEKFYGEGREDYKSRCEKAVEYMNNTFNIREVKDMFDIMNKLEDILNGKGDE